MKNPHQIICQNVNCMELAYDRFGWMGVWKCFKHGMQDLEYARKAAEARREDRCEDGPWCGCDQHRALEDVDE